MKDLKPVEIPLPMTTTPGVLWDLQRPPRGAGRLGKGGVEEGGVGEGRGGGVVFWGGEGRGEGIGGEGG